MISNINRFCAPGGFNTVQFVRCGRRSSMDGDGFCGNHDHFSETRRMMAKAKLKRQGWRQIKLPGHQGKEWICPECIKWLTAKGWWPGPYPNEEKP